VSTPRAVHAPAVRTLFRLDGLRLRGALRNPAPGPALALVLPLALLSAILWVVGRTASPAVPDAEAALLLGLLVSGPIAFSTYGTIFRAADEPTLRRIGFPAPELYVERVTRLLLLALGVALLGAVPFLAAGEPVARPLAIGLAAALSAWGCGVAAATASAQAVVQPDRQGPGVLAVGIWDAEVRAIAPLLYAPLLPFLGGTIAAAYTGAAPGSNWSRVGLVALLAVLLTARARRWHTAALPRFAPAALEMSFEPPPAGVGEMSVGRGAGRLLPRRAASVWVRDTLMVNRRFTWAVRIVWPVVILAFVGLARWGSDPATRGWVAAAALLVLLTQSLAAIGLGRLERAGRRWIDRSLGLTWQHRLLGRWTWGFGASLWLTVPLALSWSWWSGVGGAWGWIAAGAGTAAAGAVASLTAAGWR
jgi:F0F1-type ATP synthase membrane subunit c/vacuolar-type H+-ATPase subunit K